MKKTTHALLGLALMASLVTSCKKEDAVGPAPAPAPPTQEQLLAGSDSKAWVISKLIMNGQDMTKAYKACMLDNQCVYKASGSYEMNEGDTKCNTSDPHIKSTAQWKFSEDKKQLVYTYSDNSTYKDNVLELTATTMRIGGSMNGGTYEMVYSAK